MAYAIESYIKNKAIAVYASMCGTVFSDSNREATMGELEYLIERIVQDVSESPEMAKHILKHAVNYSEVVKIEEDGEGNQIVPIPDKILKRLHLKEGDAINITINESGNLEIRKKAE